MFVNIWIPPGSLVETYLSSRETDEPQMKTDETWSD